MCTDEYDDRVWLRDDVPPKQWLTGAIERGAHMICGGMCTRSPSHPSSFRSLGLCSPGSA